MNINLKTTVRRPKTNNIVNNKSELHNMICLLWHDRSAILIMHIQEPFVPNVFVTSPIGLTLKSSYDTMKPCDHFVRPDET